MKFTVSNDALGSVFMLPCDIADKYLKLATPLQLKVILYAFKNLSSGIEPEKAAEFLKADLNDVNDALLFWSERGILKGEGDTEKQTTADVPQLSMPTRSDVIRRSMEDKNITFILREAQIYFGGSLSENVSSFLVSLYDDCGMSPSVIMLLLSYAASKNKCKLAFVRSVANEWNSAGVVTVADAEKYISASAERDLAWGVVEKAFSIKHRKPSKKEAALSEKWMKEWNISPELLEAAYDECVDRKSEFIFAYAAKIIEAWHKDGIKTPDDLEKVEEEKKKEGKYGYAGYDLEKFEKMLDD